LDLLLDWYNDWAYLTTRELPQSCHGFALWPLCQQNPLLLVYECDCYYQDHLYLLLVLLLLLLLLLLLHPLIWRSTAVLLFAMLSVRPQWLCDTRPESRV
jgi:hypothetical protein